MFTARYGLGVYIEYGLMITFEVLTHYGRCFPRCVLQKRIMNSIYCKTSVSSGIWHKRSINTLFLSPCTWLYSDFWTHCTSCRSCDESVPGTITTSTATDFSTWSFYWARRCHTSHLINLCRMEHIRTLCTVHLCVSSCLHRASTVSKHFSLLFQLMHTIVKSQEC